MEAEEKDVKKRRRRSIRNLRRRSEIVPFEIDFLSEESQGEKEKEDACNFKPGIPNEKDLFGSLWMETNEPVLKKKKRRSSLFMSAPQQTHVVESQFTESEPDNVSSNGNVIPTAIMSPTVYVTETKSDYIHSPRLSVRNTCSDELMFENMPATEDNQGFLQPLPMTKTDIGCCQSTFNASTDVTPTNSVPSTSTPSSMSPEYSESPIEHLYGNSNEESYLSSGTIDKKGDLEHTQCDFDQSFISISNKENVNHKSTVPLEINLKVTETDPDITLDSRVDEDMEKNSNSSPGILSISKAIGKVVDFVKTSPSYIFGSVNGSKTDQQTTSPVLKVITDKNVISLSTSGRNNDLSFSDNDDTDCLCEKDQTLETQPREKMDIFLDTYNAIMKVFQKTSVDNDKDSKTIELNQNTITNYQEEAHSTDRGMMEASEPPTPNKEILPEIVEKLDQKERGNAANDLQTTENNFDSISSVSEINHKTDNETSSDIVQDHDQVEIENTTNYTQIIVNDYEPTSRMCEKDHEKDSLIKTVVPKTADEISWKDNKMDLNYSTEMSETTCGQECDIQTDISTGNNENTGLKNCTNTDVDHFLDTGMEMKKYETNSDVENSKTVDITKHGDLFSRPETDIKPPHINKTLPKVLSRSENIIQKYKRRSKDCATLKSQLPLKNEDVSFNKDDSEINSSTRKSAMDGQSDIKAICRKYSRKGRRSADHKTIMLDLDLPTVLEDIGGVKTAHNSVDNVELICTDKPLNSKACSGFNLESEMSVCAVPIETSLQSHNAEHKNVETTENKSYTNTVTDNNLVTQTGLVKKRRGRPIKKSVIKTEVNEVNFGTEISSIKVVEDETINDNDSAKVTKGRRRSRRSLDNNTLMAEVKSFRENADMECSGDTGKNNTDEREVENNLMFRKRRNSSDKSTLETVFEKELSESADSAKTTKLSKSKKRKTDDDVDIEKIYKNKNFIKPEQHKPWQTIFESPDKFGETLGKKRMQRYINFELPSQMKLRRRLQKATKNGWNPTSKKKTVLNDQEVKDKLNSLWLDLDSSNTKTDALEDKLRAIVETE